MKPFVPASDALIVVFSVPNVLLLGLTVMIGWLAPLSSVRTLAALPLLSSVQRFDCVVSLNDNRPIVRGVSRLTVGLTVMLSVEKSARFPAPSATIPPAQLDTVLQDAFQATAVLNVHVPLAASTFPVVTAALIVAMAAGTIFRIRLLCFQLRRALLFVLCIFEPSL